MPLNELGKIIKQGRNKHNFTQKGLGEILGVGESTVRMWELGKNRPSPERISIISSLLELDWLHLLELAGYDEVIKQIGQDKEEKEHKIYDLRKELENDFTEKNYAEFKLKIPFYKIVKIESGEEIKEDIDPELAILNFFQLENLLNEIDPIFFNNRKLSATDKNFIIRSLESQDKKKF